MRPYHTYNAVEVAFALLRHAKEQGLFLTHLQLQKLVYVCHGVSLAHLERPLILEDVHAWQYGPVIPAVYFKFKCFGADSIDAPSTENFLDDDSEAIVVGVLKSLGAFSASQLVGLTHREGSPWSRAWKNGKMSIIEDTLIQEHYQRVKTTGEAYAL